MRVQQIICPISIQKIDSNVSRLTVFINVLFMAAFLTTQIPYFMIIVSIDYFIRAVLKVEYSPIRLIAMGITGTLGLKKKPINLAQKIFASRLGVIVAVASVILFFTGATNASLIVAGMLLALSFMDSVFNYCVGCIIYNYVVYPFYKYKNLNNL